MVKYGQKNGKCVTVKAEDRPSGSAGDSASVSTPLFRISVELSLRGVCLSRASEASPLVSRRSHIFMDSFIAVILLAKGENKCTNIFQILFINCNILPI